MKKGWIILILGLIFLVISYEKQQPGILWKCEIPYEEHSLDNVKYTTDYLKGVAYAKCVEKPIFLMFNAWFLTLFWREKIKNFPKPSN